MAVEVSGKQGTDGGGASTIIKSEVVKAWNELEATPHEVGLGIQFNLAKGLDTCLAILCSQITYAAIRNFDQIHLMMRISKRSLPAVVSRTEGGPLLCAAFHVVLTAQPIRFHVHPLVHGLTRVFVPQLLYPMLLGDHVYGYLHAVHRT